MDPYPCCSTTQNREGFIPSGRLTINWEQAGVTHCRYCKLYIGSMSNGTVDCPRCGSSILEQSQESVEDYLLSLIKAGPINETALGSEGVKFCVVHQLGQQVDEITDIILSFRNNPEVTTMMFVTPDKPNTEQAQVLYFARGTKFQIFE